MAYMTNPTSHDGIVIKVLQAVLELSGHRCDGSEGWLPSILSKLESICQLCTYCQHMVQNLASMGLYMGGIGWLLESHRSVRKLEHLDAEMTKLKSQSKWCHHTHHASQVIHKVCTPYWLLGSACSMFDILIGQKPHI